MTNQDGPCRLCGQRATAKGHDGCIADLPCTKYACCGHGGSEDDAYIMFDIPPKDLPIKIQTGLKSSLVASRYKNDYERHIKGSETIRFNTTEDILNWVNTYMR